MPKPKAPEVEKRSEIAVTACGHLVKDLDELARLVVQSPRAPKLPKGIDYIGAGISKATVGICKFHVLKVCYGTGGWVGPQGLQEIEFWKKASSEVRALLAPIEAADALGRWIVAGRCVPMDRWEGEHIPNRDRAIDAMRDAGLGDLHGANIGVYQPEGAKARVVCLDYGVAAGVRGALGNKQPIMGIAAGTAVAVAPNDPWHCFTGKASAAAVAAGIARGKVCTCARCDGRGNGFHKGMGRNQRKPSLGLGRQCWTGKPAPCGCARCEGNRRLGRARLVGEVAQLGHQREMAPRDVVAPVAARNGRRAPEVPAVAKQRAALAAEGLWVCPADNCAGAVPCICQTHCKRHCCENDKN